LPPQEPKASLDDLLPHFDWSADKDMFARSYDWSIVDEMFAYDWSALDEMLAYDWSTLDEMFADLNDWSTLPHKKSQAHFCAVRAHARTREETVRHSTARQRQSVCGGGQEIAHNR
jgi:hypothetical protein